MVAVVEVALLALARLAATPPRGSLALGDALTLTSGNEVTARLHLAKDAILLDHLGEAVE
jgi:hypothetical protein